MNMVSFYKIIATSLALLAPIVAKSTPSEVIGEMLKLKDKSLSLQPLAKSITTANGPLIVV